MPTPAAGSGRPTASRSGRGPPTRTRRACSSGRRPASRCGTRRPSIPHTMRCTSAPAMPRPIRRPRRPMRSWRWTCDRQAAVESSDLRGRFLHRRLCGAGRTENCPPGVGSGLGRAHVTDAHPACMMAERLVVFAMKPGDVLALDVGTGVRWPGATITPRSGSSATRCRGPMWGGAHGRALRLCRPAAPAASPPWRSPMASRNGARRWTPRRIRRWATAPR